MIYIFICEPKNDLLLGTSLELFCFIWQDEHERK